MIYRAEDGPFAGKGRLAANQTTLGDFEAIQSGCVRAVAAPLGPYCLPPAHLLGLMHFHPDQYHCFGHSGWSA